MISSITILNLKTINQSIVELLSLKVEGCAKVKICEVAGIGGWPEWRWGGLIYSISVALRAPLHEGRWRCSAFPESKAVRQRRHVCGLRGGNIVATKCDSTSSLGSLYSSSAASPSQSSSSSASSSSSICPW
jgi:hypothetical protein